MKYNFDFPREAPLAHQLNQSFIYTDLKIQEVPAFYHDKVA